MVRIYIAAIPTYSTIAKIGKFCKASGIEASDFNHPHATIIYSQFDNTADGFVLPEHEFPIVGDNPRLVTFDTKDDGLCLVIKFDSSELYRIHNELRLQYGFQFSYGEYSPHMTLAKNIGRFITERQIDLPIEFNRIFMRQVKKS